MKMEKVYLFPALPFTYPESELTVEMEPVFAMTLPSAGVPFIRLRSVPPTERSLFPATGKEIR